MDGLFCALEENEVWSPQLIQLLDEWNRSISQISGLQLSIMKDKKRVGEWKIRDMGHCTAGFGDRLHNRRQFSMR